MAAGFQAPVFSVTGGCLMLESGFVESGRLSGAQR